MLAISACHSDAPVSPSVSESVQTAPQHFVVKRLGNGPIISPETDPSIGYNIQGPSLIRVPGWIKNPLGRYYLYFADHKGSYIRLAYADSLEGPWKIHKPGALSVAQTPFPQTPPSFTEEEMTAYRDRSLAGGVEVSQFPDIARELTTPHIASPDVHVDEANHRIIMYYHGLEDFAKQVTRVATSPDGLHFSSGTEILGRTYWRAFPLNGMTYAMAMPGVFYRSSDLLSGFEQGPTLFKPNMRHGAMFQRGATLYVAWTEVGATPPERILMSAIDVSGPWNSWKASEPIELLRPERPWEGVDRPLAPSLRSFAPDRVNQLRDPAIFEEDGRIFMLYAVAGESGIALAELVQSP